MENKNCFICQSVIDLKSCNGYITCKKCIDETRRELMEMERNKKYLSPEINCIIEDKVYLGNYDQAKLKEKLKEIGITHILVCGTGLEKLYPNDFQYEQYEIEDLEEEDIKQYFKPAIEFIEKSDKVFIHCHAGVSRSSTIVIAYIMWKNKLTFEEAYKFVKSKRSVIYPNDKFKKELRSYENDILEESSK